MMTTMVVFLLSVCSMLVLVVRWVLVTRRDIAASRDRALRAYLDWHPKRLRATKGAAFLRQ